MFESSELSDIAPSKDLVNYWLRNITNLYINELKSPEIGILRNGLTHLLDNTHYHPNEKSELINAFLEVMRIPAMYGFSSVAYLVNCPEEYLKQPAIFIAEIALYFARAIKQLQPIYEYFDLVEHAVAARGWSREDFSNSSDNPYLDVFNFANELIGNFSIINNLEHHPSFQFRASKEDFVKFLSGVMRMYPSAPIEWIITVSIYHAHFWMWPIQHSQTEPLNIDVDPAGFKDRIHRAGFKILKHAGQPNTTGIISDMRGQSGLPHIEKDWELISCIIEIARYHGIASECKGLADTGNEVFKLPGFQQDIVHFLATYSAAKQNSV